MHPLRDLVGFGKSDMPASAVPSMFDDPGAAENREG